MTSELVSITNIYPPYFTTVFVLLALTVVCLIISFVFVFMVLKTQSRGWKNVSHISWINGVFVLCISLVNSFVLSFHIIMIANTCSVLDTI